LSNPQAVEEQVMRACGVMASATLVAALAGLGTAPAAHAVGENWAINGTYLATSNGDWAKTNDSYHTEATVRSTWTIATTCVNATDCAGQVASDLGWTADIYSRASIWYVKRDVPNWEQCADGTSAPGHQIYRFIPVDANGQVDATSTTYGGLDFTTGPSGACGINKWLRIDLPFRLEKIS
jgi:hypothetical protein